MPPSALPPQNYKAPATVHLYGQCGASRAMGCDMRTPCRPGPAQNAIRLPEIALC